MSGFGRGTLKSPEYRPGGGPAGAGDEAGAADAEVHDGLGGCSGGKGIVATFG